MAIKSIEEMDNGYVIDLTGPDGNAFALLGQAKGLCRQLDLDYEEVSAEMKSGDYDNLVETFDKYFGDFVTLYR
jgi:hypothetical protein